MSAFGGYGTAKIAAGMVSFAELTLGAKVRQTLEAEIAAGNGILRGIRYCMPWDKHDEVGKHVGRHVPPGLMLQHVFREGFAQLQTLGLSFDV